MIIKTKLFEDMGPYHREIADILHDNYGFSMEEAKEQLERYYPVMERIGWYDPPEIWAEKPNRIIKEKKLSPEEWNEFINRSFGKSKDIRPLIQPNKTTQVSTRGKTLVAGTMVGRRQITNGAKLKDKNNITLVLNASDILNLMKQGINEIPVVLNPENKVKRQTGKYIERRKLKSRGNT